MILDQATSCRESAITQVLKTQLDCTSNNKQLSVDGSRTQDSQEVPRQTWIGPLLQKVYHKYVCSSTSLAMSQDWTGGGSAVVMLNNREWHGLLGGRRRKATGRRRR